MSKQKQNNEVVRKKKHFRTSFVFVLFNILLKSFILKENLKNIEFQSRKQRIHLCWQNPLVENVVCEGIPTCNVGWKRRKKETFFTVWTQFLKKGSSKNDITLCSKFLTCYRLVTTPLTPSALSKWHYLLTTPYFVVEFTITIKHWQPTTDS